jgi:hypothetical protein
MDDENENNDQGARDSEGENFETGTGGLRNMERTDSALDE